MTITIMNNSTKLSLAEIKDFLKSVNQFEFKSSSQKERNDWISSLIRYQKYYKCKKKSRGILRHYMMKITGLSKSQLTRLITKQKQKGTLAPPIESNRNSFGKKYTKADIELIAKVDNANERMSGPATIQIFKDEFNIFNKTDFENLKNISSAQFYRLRKTSRYIENAKIYSKTNPTSVAIGERKKSEPDGKPGYLSVDTVHQGDKDKEKGVYHINMVDITTQFEFIGATEGISELFMEELLERLLDKYPFKIIEFHSDNGSEFINKIVVKLLNKLLIKLTKSRPRHSNDNGLVETKNGSIIRKHIGRSHIPRKDADLLNDFYDKYFNNYINYHRPSAFAETKIDKRGKETKTYPKENYQTPYQKLKSLDNAKQYLKENITFEDLDKEALKTSHTEYAELMQKEKTKTFNKIHERSKLINKLK